MERQRLLINGIVQGVGFRPFTFRLAGELQLTGFIRNRSDGVVIEIQGDEGRIEEFRSRLKADLPPLARITEVDARRIPVQPEADFRIASSTDRDRSTTLIPPDVAVCAECLRELFDEDDRRYRYPFINCTNCGPRFTIMKGIPYDRPNTSMHSFPLCTDCREEFENPQDRRFHAQPNACPSCGPKVRLVGRDGHQIHSSDWVSYICRKLTEGWIFAIKGIGGFHLVVDPTNDDAVGRLRQRKGREEKPFALMARDLETIRRYCHVSSAEEEALKSWQRPIVLLEAREFRGLSRQIAPGNRYLGFMLPYSPLHSLLLAGDLETLVMTSGNLSDEPIAVDNDEAVDRLSSLADCFLLHDRDILQRCDDSVLFLNGDEPGLIRRSRGYVPMPVEVDLQADLPILACGGQLKNTIALCRKREIFLSQHIGDLDHPSAYRFFRQCIGLFSRILEIEPRAVAYDLHPGYLSTQWALEQESLPRLGVQHHHAHLASVMAENGVTERCLGIILDGTGYGTDQTIWGGELLAGDLLDFERLGWIRPFPLLGGEKAVRQPWRIAVALLHAAYGENFSDLDPRLVNHLNPSMFSNLTRMIDRRIHSPMTSSCGRLFDGVAALLDIRREVTFEAQAAVELEMKAASRAGDSYREVVESVRGLGPLDIVPLIRAIVEDRLHSVPVELISTRFHYTLAEMLVKQAVPAGEKAGIHRIGLSGGVFQNRLLARCIRQGLEANGFEVLIHKKVPCNDGGLALGQIAVADARLAARSSLSASAEVHKI